MPRVTHGRVARDTISVGGCTIVSGANSLQTRLINEVDPIRWTGNGAS